MKTRGFFTIAVLFAVLIMGASSFAELWPVPTGAIGRLGTGKITDQVVHSPATAYFAVPSLSNIWVYNSFGEAQARVDSGQPGDWFMAAAFSADGSKIAGATKYGSVKIADASTGKVLHSLSAGWSSVASLAYSPDGNKLASGDSWGTIKVWDVSGTSPTLARTIYAYSEFVMGLAFSPDSTKLASCSGDTYGDGWDNALSIWNASTGALLHNITDHTGGVESVAFSRDGTMLASASLDKTVRLWNPSTGAHLRTLTHPDLVRSVSFSPTSNNQLVTGCDDKKARMWDASTGAFLYSPTDIHTQAITSVAFNHDGTQYVTSSGSVGGPTDGDSLIMLYNLGAGAGGSLFNHTNDIQCVAFSPDGTKLAGKSWDTYTRIYDHKTGEQVSARVSSSDQQCSVSCVVYSPDGKKMLIVQNWDNIINVYDAEGQINLGVHLPTQKLTAHTEPIYSVAYSPDGTKFASVSRDRTVIVWDASTMTVLHTLRGHTESVCGVAFSKDSNTVASGSYDTTIRLWNANTGAHIRTLTGHTNGACAIAFSPTVNNKLVSAGKGEDTTVRVWDTDTGKALNVFTPSGYVGEFNSVAFSRDGTFVAAASYDATVRVWNVNTATQVSTLRGHSQNVASVAFSPTEDILASGSSDGTILLWNVGEAAAAPQLISQFSEEPRGLNAEPVVTDTALFANYPNPFNPETWIPYQLAAPADVSISIYSAGGTLVRTLALGMQDVGHYESRAQAAYWDGRNQSGEPVASGVYFYTLKAGEFTATRKMLILK